MKYATFNTILSLLLTFQFLPAQAPDTLWTRTYGGNQVWAKGISVQQTTDDGYIITGSRASTTGDVDVLLIKTDALGDTIWTRTYGRSGYDSGYSVDKTTDGGYIVVGTTHSLDYSLDILLIRTDASGDTLWLKTYDGGYNESAWCVKQTTDGGYIISGVCESFARSYLLLIKTDAAGDTVWIKIYGEKTDYRGSGSSVQQTTDGGYIITGWRDITGVSTDVLVMKTDSLGDTLWTNAYGGIGGECGLSIQQTTDGGYIIAGYIERDVWLIKTNSLGDSLWSNRFDFNGIEEGRSVQQTTDEGYIIAGYTRSFGAGDNDVLLIKTDSSGDTLWTQTYGGNGNDVGMCVQQTSDGGYIICGIKNHLTDSSQVWLIKIAPDPSMIKRIESTIISYYQLHQNFPNPFNPSTTIKFTLPQSEYVELKVFDIVGKQISTLVSKKLNSGNHTYTFNGKNLASGIYYYQLVAGEYREMKNMILLR